MKAARETRTTPSIRALLGRALGIAPDLGGEGPLVVFVRVPAWLGNRARHPENCEPPLDLGYAAAVARRAGCRAAIVDLETGAYDPREVERCLAAARPGAVFLSAITPAVPSALRLAAAVKDEAPDCLVVACGHHADAEPATLLAEGSPVDLCVRGELEATLPDLLAALRAGRDVGVAGTASRRGGEVVDHGPRPPVEDLDALPLPAHDFFRSRSYRHLHPMRGLGPFRWGAIQAGRGCPFGCIYCSRSLRTSFGSRYRLRRAAGVAAEATLLARSGVNALIFTDDVFNTSRERVLELCEALRSSGARLSWKAQGRVVPADLQMFRAMRAAGCSTFSIGVESGSPRILETLDKKTTVEQTERAFRLAREAGLYRVGFFMVGAPGETEADFQATERLLHRLDPEMIQVAYFTCYPGSRAYADVAAAQGLSWERFQHYQTFLNCSGESDETVRLWQKRLYRSFLLRPAFVARYLRMKHVNLLLDFGSEWFLARQALRSVLLS